MPANYDIFNPIKNNERQLTLRHFFNIDNFLIK